MSGLCREWPVVLVPSHRSYLDFILVSYVLLEHNLPLPCIAAGLGEQDTYVRTYTHTYTHTHTYIHTYIHIYIHIYIHTYIHIYIHTSVNRVFFFCDKIL